MPLTISQIIESYKISTLINPANTIWLSSHIFTVSNTYFIKDMWKCPVFHMLITDIPSLVNILLAQTYMQYTAIYSCHVYIQIQDIFFLWTSNIELNPGSPPKLPCSVCSDESKKDDKDQEAIQSSTTSDLEYQMRK